MRMWDIVDVVDIDAGIATTRPNRSKFRGAVTSAAKAAFLIGTVIASSAFYRVPVNAIASTVGNRFQFADSIELIPPRIVPSLKLRAIASETDTQFGQSTSKLAQLMHAYFQPAEDEVAYEDDYSF